MLTLSIETSCDETGIALLECSGGVRAPKFKVLENLVASQIPVHKEFGGVVPNLAKRDHLQAFPLMWDEIVHRQAKTGKKKTQDLDWALMKKIDLITVTVGPGLEPALWTGIEFAKGLAKKYKKPLIGANHLEGHLYSFLLPGQTQKTPKSKLQSSRPNLFPAVALIVSGGHTILLKVDSFTKWKYLGETRDDAAGEAFDKVARLLELPYPGGPEIEKLAREGNPNAIAFPRPMLKEKNFDFSFSGLKTAVLFYVRDTAGLKITNFGLDSQSVIRDNRSRNVNRADIAASFQSAVIDVLVQKTIRAAEQAGARSIILCGGVAANNALRGALKTAATKSDCQFFVPEFKYNLDNASMIGAAGYMAYLRKKNFPLKANGNLSI